MGSAPFILPAVLLILLTAALHAERRRERAHLRQAHPAARETLARRRHPAGRGRGQEEALLTLDEEHAWRDITARLGAPQEDRRG